MIKKNLNMALLFAIFVLSACSEYLPVSGGALEGTVTALPQQWGEVSDVEVIQYGNRPRNENVDETYLFRLTPRR
jgi:hypothetical protein